jgi:hypothetical protein
LVINNIILVVENYAKARGNKYPNKDDYYYALYQNVPLVRKYANIDIKYRNKIISIIIEVISDYEKDINTKVQLTLKKILKSYTSEKF